MTETFQERLRRLRTDRGLGPTELARLANVHKVSIFQWENYIKQPRMDGCIALAKALNVTLDYLVTGRENPAHATLLAAVRASGTRDPRLLALIDRSAI